MRYPKAFLAVVVLFVTLTLTIQAQDTLGQRYPDTGMIIRDVAGSGRPTTSIRAGELEVSGVWKETMKVFTSILCTTACGTGAGTTGPHNGTGWAWFGGTDAKQKQSLSQPLYLPKTSSIGVGFYYWVGKLDIDANAKLTVRLDGKKVWGGPVTVLTLGYQAVYVDLTAYADGGVHTLEFFYKSKAATESTNISVDSITLYKGDAFGVVNPGFESGGLGWLMENATNDGVSCSEPNTKAYTGNCALRFKGSTGENSSARQVYLRGRDLVQPEATGLRAPPYYRVYLGAFVKSSAQSKGKLKFLLGFNDGSTVKGKVSLKGLGPYTWKQTPPKRYSALLIGEYLEIVIVHKSPSGKVWIDDVEMFYASDYG